MSRLPRPCPVCDEIFEPRKVGLTGRWTETCSRSCGSNLGAQRRNERGNGFVGKPGPRVELTCEVCGGVWTTQPSQVKGRRCCSMVCSAKLKRIEQGGKRKGAANPNFKNGSRVAVRDRAGERRWYSAAGTRCAVPDCNRRRQSLALHHIVYRQELRRLGADEWDPRNALTVCNSCHMSHHKHGRVLELSMLPDSVFEFAIEVMGYGPAYMYLSRRYRGGDDRLDAMISNEEAA